MKDVDREIQEPDVLTMWPEVARPPIREGQGMTFQVVAAQSFFIALTAMGFVGLFATVGLMMF
jgi:hypothetical protein